MMMMIVLVVVSATKLALKFRRASQSVLHGSYYGDSLRDPGFSWRWFHKKLGHDASLEDFSRGDPIVEKRLLVLLPKDREPESLTILGPRQLRVCKLLNGEMSSCLLDTTLMYYI